MRTKLKKLIIAIGYRTYKIVRAPFKWYWKIFKIQTQGVRVLITFQGELILVRHWYNSLWVMPGGGIKKHETPEQAAIREIKEETGIHVQQLEYLLGTYINTKEGKNDKIYCYVVELDKKIDMTNQKFNIEISDCRWVAFSNIPEGTSVATQERIREYRYKEISSIVRPW